MVHTHIEHYLSLFSYQNNISFNIMPSNILQYEVACILREIPKSQNKQQTIVVIFFFFCWRGAFCFLFVWYLINDTMFHIEQLPSNIDQKARTALISFEQMNVDVLDVGANRIQGTSWSLRYSIQKRLWT